MAEDFCKYVGTLRELSERREPRLEVAAHGKDKLNEEQRWQREYLKASGAVMKAQLRPPADRTAQLPKDHDEMLIHFTVRRAEDEKVVRSTRQEFGGTGVPYHFLLGKYCKELYGLELGLRQMQRGERAILKILPEYLYDHPKSKERNLVPPDGVTLDDTLLYDVELLDHYRVRVVDYDEALVLKREITEGDGWESPRYPFEVEATIQGFSLRADGDEEFFPSTTIKYSVGDGQLPKGLEEGINNMCLNEKAWIRCMSDRYQTSTAVVPGVPSAASAPDGILYIVTLHYFMQVRDLLGDGTTFKRRVKEGEGEFPADCPMHDCDIKCHYVARTIPDRTVVYDSRGDDGAGAALEFPIGQGVQPMVLETCVRLMLKNETSIVTSDAHSFYKQHKELLPPGVRLDASQKMEFEVVLQDFVKPANWYNIDYAGALKDSEEQKEQGNLLYKQGKFRLARAKYHKTAAQIDGLRGLTSEQWEPLDAIRVHCHLNFAQCCIRQEEYHEAITRLNEKVLKHHDHNAKGLYRRAVAYIATGFFAEARADIERLREVDAAMCKDADALLVKCRRAEQQFAADERKAFQGKLSS